VTERERERGRLQSAWRESSSNVQHAQVITICRYIKEEQSSCDGRGKRVHVLG
jgi:hypothetical protein